MEDMIKFDLPKNQSSIIKVMGVGGGGSNAVTHMYNLGINGVDFIICNTDTQAMDASPVPTKIQLGSKGLGAGSIPAVGREAALEKTDEIREILEKNTQMLFITAGMGGGTGTGAAPVIAEIARELGILTVGIITMPFSFEGRKRKMQAEEGVEDLRKNVDTLLLIVNDKLRLLHGDLKLSEAFNKADDILCTAAKGIAEIITVTGYINVDFEDVKTVMKESGKAIMGSGIAEGEDRAHKAVVEALESPLLNDNQIKGASNILLYIASGEDEISMDEVVDITDHIQREAQLDDGTLADVIWGGGTDDTLGNKISVTLIATGFETRQQNPVKKHIMRLNEKVPENVNQPEKETEKEEKIELINKKEKEPEEKESSGEKENTGTNPDRTIIFDFTAGDTKPKTGKKHVSEPTTMNDGNEKEKNEIENKQEVSKSHDEDQEQEEMEKRSQDRIKKLKDLSIKLRSPQELSELEKQPAYVRRNVKLFETPDSSESNVSKYSLSESKDKQSSPLKKNNSFLHDKPD